MSKFSKKMNSLSSYTRQAVISYGIVLVGFVLMFLGSSTGLIGSNLQGQFVPICVYVTVAIALNLVVGISGELSLGHAGFMAVGAFTGIIASTVLGQAGMPPVVRIIAALLIGMICAGIVGAIIGIPVLGLRGDYLAIVTLAFGEIIKNILNIVYVGIDDHGFHFALNQDVKMEPDGIRILAGPMGATSNETLASLPVGIIVVLIALFVVLNIINSKQGRGIMAIRDNRIAGESIGLNIMKYKMTAFVVSAALAGMGGALFGLNYSSLAPMKFNFNTSVLILVFVVLGGIGNIWGGIIAAAILTIIPEALREFADYRMLTYAIVLIVVMIATYNPLFKARVAAVKEKVFKSRKKKEVA